MEYKGKQLSCTEEELKLFIDNLPITYEVYKFSDRFKGQMIPNPTKDENARYYVLQVGNRTFLQPHAPFEMGIVPLTEENVYKYIERHSDELIDMEIFEKFGIQPEDTLEAVQRKNTELEAITKGLIHRNAALLDDQLYILEKLAEADLINR